MGREYSFRVRLIYKLFLSDDDVVQEVRKSQAELGFARAPGSGLHTGDS